MVATAVSLLWLGTSPAGASCAAAAEVEHFRSADVVFEGVMQPGRTDGRTLLSPARVSVLRYLKGGGPEEVLVETAVADGGNGMYSAISTGIHPAAGERWLIYADRGVSDVLGTSACHGSRLIGDARGSEPPPTSGSVGVPPAEDPLRWWATSAVIAGGGTVAIGGAWWSRKRRERFPS